MLPTGIRPVRLDAFVEQRVAQPGVVRDSSLGCAREFVEHLRRIKVPDAGRVEPPGELRHDPQLAARAGRRLERLPSSQHAPLEVGHRALLLGPLQDRAARGRPASPSRRGRSRTPPAGRAAPARRARSARSARTRRRSSRARAAPAPRQAVPADWSSCTAGMPGPGMMSGSTPHTPATCARAAASVILRYPGSWSLFCPCSRPPWPLP